MSEFLHIASKAMNAKIELLDDGRNVRLIEPVVFVDYRAQVWEAPALSVVNGASIPRFLWSWIGSPFVGRYRKASILHDVYCVTRSRPSHEVHAMFYEKCIADGVSRWVAWLLWAAVRFFGPRFKGAERDT